MTMCGIAATRSQPERERALLEQRGTITRGPVELERQPDAQTRKSPRKVGPELMRVVQVRFIVGLRHVAARRRVRRLEHRSIGDEQSTGAVRQKHALVRVERQRIGSRQSREQRSQARGTDETTHRRLHRCDARDPRRAEVGNLGQGSTAPVFVVPADETTRNGCNPSRRSRAIACARARRRACGMPSRRRWRGPDPASRRPVGRTL